MPSPEQPPRKPSLLLNVIPITLFMLVCGVVGPIFLVMGLVVDGPETGWLLPMGIAITALDILIGITVGLFRHRSKMRTYRLHQVGKRGIATVLDAEPTSVTINDQPLMKLRVRIHGDDIATFEVERKQVVPHARMALLHAGELPVIVDPETQEWEVDWASARPVRAAFTAPTAERPAADRLAELDQLLKQDLISRDEYDASRARILDGI